MRTRRGLCYSACSPETRRVRRRRLDPFEALPDDLLLCVFSKLGASANSPLDLINLLLTCKRFNGLAMDPIVLVKASEKCLEIHAKNWCDSSHRFLKRFTEAGNLEACYILGMIRFYCLAQRETGAALMARAAIGRHAAALYSLAVIQFNGSGGSKHDRDLRAGAALCYRAAACGSVDALRELGHCLQDGYGVKRAPNSGRRLLLLATTLEYTRFVSSSLEGNVANLFLIDWFQAQAKKLEPEGGMKSCSHLLCGRVETRPHEFRRCSVCGIVNYCSRACQALHWRAVHKAECGPTERWEYELVGV
ncbi:hypothetical protein LUZ60_004813 [Juncus effusus]|nr:hypothetical protein LUZ60_004813 [Juncus effusus]